MSALGAAVLVTGSRTVLMLDGDEARDAVEVKISSAIAVENRVTLPGTVKGLRMPATTAAVEATFPESARSRRRRGSRCATLAARRAMWLVTVTMPTSRSAIPVEVLATFKKAVKKSSATGVVRSVMLPCTAARPARSTATTVASPVTWQKSAPSRPQLNQFPWLRPSFF